MCPSGERSNVSPLRTVSVSLDRVHADADGLSRRCSCLNAQVSFNSRQPGERARHAYLNTRHVSMAAAAAAADDDGSLTDPPDSLRAGTRSPKWRRTICSLAGCRTSSTPPFARSTISWRRHLLAKHVSMDSSPRHLSVGVELQSLCFALCW